MRHRFALTAALLLLAVSGPAMGQPASGSRMELAPGVTFQVTDLRRLTDKGAMQLKFTLSNATSGQTSARAVGIATGYRLDAIEVVDFASKRSFNIGSASRCLCSTFTDGGAVEPGQTREFWAWYGLPPAGVQTVSLQLGSAPPLLDVPLQP